MELERYQLVRTIASGGMGQVYEAVARGHGGFIRRVAIKRLLPELLGDDAARRLFRDEAHIASHLHHGNIVQVLDYGVVDGAEFLVLEYVEGIDANRLLAQLGRPLPTPVALHVVAEIGHALAYAHDRRDDGGGPLGIVHRDVSAHNILMSWEGDVKLSDFGIALAVARDGKTETGVVKGKLGYLAPEQIRGERATAAADVFALGVTLHVLIAGELPGKAPGATGPVAALIARCIAPDAAARPVATVVARDAARLAGGAGRSELSELLATVRGAAAPRSALDDLMGMALVPSGDGAFTVDRTGRSASAAEPPTGSAAARVAPAGGAAVDVDPHADVVTTTSARVHRPRRTVAVVAASAAIAGGIGFALILSSSSTGRSTSRPADPRLARALAAAIDAAPPPAATDAATRSPGPPAPLDASPPIDARRGRTDPRVRRADAAPIDARAVQPSARGWVRIGGRALVNASVAIDGSAVGLAPLERELPVGRHRIVVRAADGEVLLDRSIVVAERDTRQEPVKVMH